MSYLSDWALQSPSDDFWLIVSILIVLAVAGFFGAFYFFARKRTIENTPTSKIRSAAQGYIELSGQGRLLEGPPILAPLTGRYCTWYSYTIEEHRRSGKNSRWINIENGVSDSLFLIADDTGQCVIDPEGASVTAVESDTWYGNTQRPSTGPRAGGGFFSFRSGRYRYREQRMHPGDPLYAMGLFNTVGGAGGEFNVDTDVRDLLKEWKSDSETLLREFDKNSDGEIDIHEWQQVREHALREVLAKHNERKTGPPVNMLTRTRDRRRPFILSAVPQESLIRRYFYFSLVLITTFFIAGTIAVWCLNLRLQ